MIVVMAEVASKCPPSHIIIPEQIENPISWCEMVIASQDIHYASHEMTISHRERRFTMCIKGMRQDKNKYKKPMASSEGSALVAMTASAVGKQVFLRATTVTATVMTSMTSEDTTDKKRPSAVKKSPAHAGKKRDWLSGDSKRLIAKQRELPNLFKRTGVYPW